MKLKNISEKILKTVKSKGFKYIELDSLIDANSIVERSGENFRKFIFSFYDQNGKEICLRPDLTIASCLRYISKVKSGRNKVFYKGQAYRRPSNKFEKIIKSQIGFEIIGSKKEKEDDKEILESSIKLVSNFKYSKGSLKIGNVEIFNLFISKLDIPKRWKLRLTRHFWRKKYFDDLLRRLETNSDIDPTIVEVDKKKFKSLIRSDPKKLIAGRSVGEILLRFENKIKDPRKIKKGKKISKIIKDFLKIRCPISKAAYNLNIFFKKNNINLIVDQRYFPVSKNNINKLNVEYYSAFGRELEYYTGIVFKIDIKNKKKIINILNGGRYDNLILNLSGKKVPAVGAAVNLS
tara:strand:- start:1501 stop:2547 length:1047 start_codon:yes stop_codon:yes gene_type:complete